MDSFQFYELDYYRLWIWKRERRCFLVDPWLYSHLSCRFERGRRAV